MPNRIVDAAERLEALSPARSFCVTAPAGSGKTSLLIQRYLTLLARVEKPQEVLAITFTRKAAAEMRSRIGEALALAASGVQPEQNPDARTFALAREVLAADARHGWQLALNAAQLNIATIDSFCGTLTRQMPVLSRFGGPITAVDDAYPYYREATRMLLEQLDAGGPGAADLATLLLYFDNNWRRLEALLVAMLQCREQWLVYLGTGLDRARAQAAVEHAVETLCEETLTRLDRTLAPWRVALSELWQYSRDHMGNLETPAWPGTNAAEVTHWHALITLLLTATGSWRRTLTKREGFPAGGGEAAERKAAMKALLEELQAVEGLQELLLDARRLPSSRADDEQWGRVLACSRLLPQLAAQLSVVFQQHGVVDHTQVSLSALDALGGDECPTELALKLDYRLQHILVDEFQDTAVHHFELIRRLTRGWAEHNMQYPEAARTLFIVGDGMQSIYGFRQAEVGLFIRARQQGVGDLKLTPLTLRTNFRSAAALVTWVNATFENAFPAQDNMNRGEITFSSAVPFHDSPRARPVTLAAFQDGEAEAAWLATQVDKALADGSGASVAILVRRKADLLALIPALKARGLSWNARDIDSLADSEVVRDISNLAQALHNPMDRVAWLALLRAPWCGLSNADLLSVATAAGEGSIWRTLAGRAADIGLAADGMARVAAIRSTLRSVFEHQERLPLRDWVEYAWLKLDGPACVEDPGQLEDAEALLTLLDQIEADGERYAPGLVSERIARLYSHSTNADSKLELMTLHKAKGLEFDRVFIPNLAQGIRGESRDLLLWDDHHTARGEVGFMLAMEEPGEGEATLYDFLYERRKVKRQAEAVRLLYVGATRAANQLTLSASLAPDGEGGWRAPPKSALLAAIWNSIAHQFEALDGTVPPPADAIRQGPAMRRIAYPCAPAEPPDELPAEEPNIPEPPGDGFRKALGTVIHGTLERLAGGRLPERLDPVAFQPWWRRELATLGVSRVDEAIEAIGTAVDRVLADERGRWLLSPEREDAHCEFPLSCLLPDGRLAEFFIDRVFVAGDVRWLVDYKSSVPDSGQSLSSFVAEQEARYRSQLENYRNLMAGYENREVRCALYFTALPLWHELT